MEWIKCEDRMPEVDKANLAFVVRFYDPIFDAIHCGTYIGADTWRTPYQIYFKTNQYFKNTKQHLSVTHWCEITPPEDV